MTENMIGRIFNNRYQITERIGIGGMAEVYRAQDNVLGRLVAVKVMLPQYAADPNFTQRFKREAAAAANLQSPYIVNVYDWGQDKGTYYIVMEFVRGSDLKTAITQRGAINQRKVAEIGSQVCQALCVAHSLDIIHRDIKPQNIMVQPDGNVKVMDFGIARAKNSVGEQTSSVLGTAHYISPEQAQGKELTAASDIYSLGVVLYESVTGYLPFDGPDAISVAMKQVNELPRAPHEIKPDIDPALESIIMKALAKNPLERFSTAQDMRLALNDYLAGRPVNVGTNGFTGAQTALMGAVVAPGGGAMRAERTSVMPTISASPTTNAAHAYYPDNGGNTHNNSKKGAKTFAIVVAIIAALAIIVGLVFVLLPKDSGADAIVVPDVVGKTVDEATETLTEAGFEVKTEEVFNEKEEPGKVTKQDPRARSKHKKGSTVTLFVSKGTQDITVPDLTNLTGDEARKELNANGLKYREGKAEHSDSVEKDHVARQSPAAGEKVAKGDVVTCYLSLGVEKEVPDVVGLSQGEATTILSNAGFTVNTSYQASDKPKDTVVSQTPAAGEKLAEDGSVALTISEGPQTKTYSVAVNSNGGGTITPSVTTVEEGGQVTITITPHAGYKVAQVRGLDDVPASGGTFTLTNVSNNINIYVDFQSAS